MIKKAVHEDELIYGMQRELQGHNKKQAMANLDKAGNYLQAAMEILESVGLTKQSDAVLEILAKIAARPQSQVMEMPSIAKLFAKGLTPADMKASADPTHPQHHTSKSKIRNILRNLGHEEAWIDKFLGAKPKVDPVDVGSLFPQELPPVSSPEGAKPLTGLINQLSEEEAIKALPSTTAAEHHHHPGRPDKIHDPHVKGLTPEKMVENLKHHGIVFNMADDGQDNKLLDADVNQAELEVTDKPIAHDLHDFEEEADANDKAHQKGDKWHRCERCGKSTSPSPKSPKESLYHSELSKDWLCHSCFDKENS